MYGMTKTTVYLPDEVKEDLERLAKSEGRSEAEIIRGAVAQAIAARRRPRPRVPLTGSGLGDPHASERSEELLSGFGN